MHAGQPSSERSLWSAVDNEFYRPQMQIKFTLQLKRGASHIASNQDKRLNCLIKSPASKMSKRTSASRALLALCGLLLLSAISPSLANFVGRRAADDSRPLSRVEQAGEVIIGRFRAPAPEMISRHRLAKSAESGLQTMSASLRVADSDVAANSPKVVNGVSAGSTQRDSSKPVKVSAKMQVTDEGLNYPPSKLSADIYGNVAEIVTAPPEALESDFLIPQSSEVFGSRRYY